MGIRSAPGWLGLALAAAASVGAAAPPDRVVRLAILPCTNIETTFGKFQPLLAHLRAAAGVRVQLVVPADFEEFEAAVANARIDFALQDPHTFRRLAPYFDDASLLQTLALDGTTRQAAVVVVRRDSAVRDLGDLRGRAVMFGPRTSSPKWEAARLLFEARGVDVDRQLRLVSGGCCEDIAFSVAVRSVDAGVICDHFLGSHEARQRELGIDPSALRVIGQTASFPTRIFAARKGLSPELVRAVTAALLALDPATPSHRALLARAEMAGLTRVSAARYLAALEDARATGRR